MQLLTTDLLGGNSGQSELYSAKALLILILLLIVAFFASYIVQQKKVTAIHETVVSILGGGWYSPCHNGKLWLMMVMQGQRPV